MYQVKTPLTIDRLYIGSSQNIKPLVASIPKNHLLQWLSSINNYLLLNNDIDSSTLQLKILDHILDGFEYKQSFITMFSNELNENNFIFSVPCCELFLNNVIHEDLGSSLVNKLTPTYEDRIAFIKAQLIINKKFDENFNSKIDLDQTILSDKSRFNYGLEKKLIFTLGQFDVNKPPDYFYNLISIWLTLDYLSSFEEQGKAFRDFLNFYETKDFWELLSIQSHFNPLLLRMSATDFNLYHFAFFDLKNLNKNIVKSLELNLSNKVTNCSDSENLRLKPIIKLQEDNHLVLNLHYLFNAINKGLLFNFIEKTSSKESYQGLKGKIGDFVVEKKIFKNVLQILFKKSINYLLFDDKKNINIDAHCRVRNSIFLFELKDALMPTKVYNSNSLKEIYNDLELKYAQNNKKGIYQLIQHIELISSTAIQLNTKIQRNRNSNIYPILVYTDDRYSAPGIREYLNQIFTKEVKAKSLSSEFSSIKELTFMNLKTLFKFALNNDNFDFKSIINKYLERLKSNRKSINKNYSDKKTIGATDNFEDLMSDILYRPKKADNNLSLLIEKFDLNNKIPKG